MDNTEVWNTARKMKLGIDFYKKLDELLIKLESEKMKCDMSFVSQRSKLLKVEDKDIPFDDYVKRFFKEPKIELIYISKKNGNMMTEKQLIKYYKRAMCL